MIVAVANPDLVPGPDQREAWVTPDNRRQGFPNPGGHSPVSEHLPEIGSGYAAATVEDVMNMNVVNGRYRESWRSDDDVAMAWRLPPRDGDEPVNRSFLCNRPH